MATTERHFNELLDSALERLGRRVTALCSRDGEEWFTVGHVEFPAADPLQVGLHAIGMIDRLSYPGAWPEGTAMRFESFQLFVQASGSSPHVPASTPIVPPCCQKPV